ncbi:MAG: NAD(P)/FAD-dependent oxidoreductase, partial [Peptococcales bacterium]
MRKIAIIGAGAAGLMAAVGVIQNGCIPVIFEKNNKAGIKLLITGKGRCNLSNDIDPEDFVKSFPGNGYFLYSSIYNFDSIKLRTFFESIGVSTKVERGGRIFPHSDKAKDVVNSLVKYIINNGAIIKYNSPVERLWIQDNTLMGIITKGSKERFSTVIIATGGKSYPKTGSTGDGYKLAREAGHTIVEPYPSLVPLETDEDWVKDVQGLTLKNVEVKVFFKNKLISKEFGEMIFTHFGISGPIILTLSRKIVYTLIKKGKPVIIKLNLKPALSAKQIDNR